MNVKEIKEMIGLMNDNNLLELELERDGLKLRLKKESKSPVFEAMPQPSVKYVAQTESAKEVHEEVPQAKAKKGTEIKSPMVGTFYRAPSPEAPSFVEVGAEVGVGQVLCIIEAMKLMNEIKNEMKCKVIEVLVENGQPVEFGQPLFLVEPL